MCRGRALREDMRHHGSKVPTNKDLLSNSEELEEEVPGDDHNE